MHQHGVDTSAAPQWKRVPQAEHVLFGVPPVDRSSAGCRLSAPRLS
jgi:hypothetical protein